METINELWSPAPKDLTFAGHEVHVWRAQLDLPASQVQELRGVLTENELGRADRFSFAIDRQRFIVARGTLRAILSRYLSIDPGHLRFHYNPYGKPFLAAECSSDLLNFNLSHSGGMALYAMTRDMEVGVDLERVRSGFAYKEIAEHFFSASEVASLRRIPAEQKLEAFYTCWTRKEAYIKAHGEGLSLPLDSFDVSFSQWEPPMLLKSGEGPQECSHWTLRDLKPVPGYVGAVALKRTGCRFRFWEWEQHLYVPGGSL